MLKYREKTYLNIGSSPSLAFISIFSLDALRPGFRPRFPLSLRSCWSQNIDKYRLYI